MCISARSGLIVKYNGKTSLYEVVEDCIVYTMGYQMVQQLEEFTLLNCGRSVKYWYNNLCQNDKAMVYIQIEEKPDFSFYPDTTF